MGFFSSIGSFISSVGSALGTAARSIGSALGSVGRALGSFASSAVGIVGQIASKASAFVGLLSTLPLGPLGPIIGPIVAKLVFKVVAKGIEYLAKKLGIIDEKEAAEEVGYRVEEAAQHDDWKKQEDFDSFAEYYAYLKEQIPDTEINLARLKENRDRYIALGTMELTKGLEERMDIALPEDFLFEIGRSRMEGSEIQAIVEAYKTLGYDSVNFSGYLKGKLGREESKQIEEALLSNMKKYYPNKDEEMLYERLGTMRAASRDDEKLADVYSDKLTKEKLEKIANNPEYVDDPEYTEKS